jgi:hypothetical protein
MKFVHSVMLATVFALAPAVDAPARSANDRLFSQAELDQMLAPVALYPDTVLSHVLIAATYPLEVIQAARWSRANPDFSGQVAVEAVQSMNWDPSVMALVAFPELLYRLDEDIEWTHRLGDAFLLQEEQVVGTIQTLRDRAYAHGHLRSNDRVRIVREKEYIYIEPARTRIVHLPYYDPYVVYGSWRWSRYPPIRWRHPARFVRGVSFFWGPAYRIAPTFYFSSFHWPRRQVVVVKHHHHHYHGQGRANWRFHSGRDVARYKDARRWRHKPEHRRGVTYRQRIDERHLAGQARSRSNRVASAQQQISSRSSQRSWASKRRNSLRLSERSTPSSTSKRARPSNRARLRSAQSNRSTSRSAAEFRTTSDGARARSSAPRSATAGRVRERLRRSPSTTRAHSSAEARQRSRAASRPATESKRSRAASIRPSARLRSSRPESSPTTRVRRESRTRSPARASSNSARSRPLPRSAAPRTTAPSRSSPNRAPSRAQSPQRSAARAERSRSASRGRPAARAMSPRRSSAPPRSMPRRTPGRSAAPTRQAGPSRQRARASSTRSRERSRIRD